MFGNWRPSPTLNHIRKSHINYKHSWDIPPSREPIKQLCVYPDILYKCKPLLVNKLAWVYLCLTDATNSVINDSK